MPEIDGQHRVRLKMVVSVCRTCIQMYLGRLRHIRTMFTKCRVICSRSRSKEANCSANSTSARRSFYCLRLQRTSSSVYHLDRKSNTVKRSANDACCICGQKLPVAYFSARKVLFLGILFIMCRPLK